MATVTDFSEAELWYIYEALTTGTFAGATQKEIYEIFNGTNPEGKALSLFENQTVNKTSIADILYFSNGYLSIIDNNVGDIKNLIDTKTATATNQTTANNSLSNIDTKLTTETTNTGNISTYLSTIRTPVIISTSASATISGQLHNISVYNSGSATGTLTVGATTINLPAGVTVNYDAGGNNNRFATNTFGYNATGTTFIISYVS